MLIHEAVQKAMESNGWIIRESIELFKHLAIKPTNTGFNCVVKGKESREAPNWNPSAEDLLATDWKVVAGEELLWD